MPWILRDATTNAIIGEAALKSSTFSDSVLITDPDYIAYLLSGKKSDKIKQLKGRRDEVIGGCVEYSIGSTDHKFQVDGISAVLLNGAIAVKERGNTTFFPIDWIDADNVSVSVTSEQLIGILDLGSRLIAACYDNYQAHRIAIDDATSQAELDAVDITAGWPAVPYTGV